MRLRCCPCFRRAAAAKEEILCMSSFEIPPRRRSEYQGVDGSSKDRSSRSRSKYIQPELYESYMFDDTHDYSLFEPPSLEDRVKREELDCSFGCISFSTKVCAKKVTVRMRELRGLPPKGPQRNRTYWTTARVCIRKCTKKFRAVRGNDKDSSIRLNEELVFLGSAGDTVQIIVYEESNKEKPLSRVDILGYCEVILGQNLTNSIEDTCDEDEELHIVKLTQSLVPTPLGQLLLSLNYEDLTHLTVAVIKTEGLPDTSIKIVMRCNGEKVKKGRIKGNGPIYNQSFKFILPEQFLASTSVLLTLTGCQRKQLGFCVTGPWSTYSDGRLTQWGEMLVLKKRISQWRHVYPVAWR